MTEDWGSGSRQQLRREDKKQIPRYQSQNSPRRHGDTEEKQKGVQQEGVSANAILVPHKNSFRMETNLIASSTGTLACAECVLLNEASTGKSAGATRVLSLLVLTCPAGAWLGMTIP